MSLENLKAPFIELHHLLKDIPQPNDVIDLAIGAPRHPPPDFIIDVISQSIGAMELTRYPPTAGLEILRQNIAQWLLRRFDVTIDEAHHILPVSGTREALFLFAISLALQKSDKRPNEKKVIIVPDPSYQCYAAAAYGAGCEPIYLPAIARNHFLPDLDVLEEKIASHYQNRILAFYLCSPANPQSVIADEAYLKRAYALARHYDFTLIADECYADIYDVIKPQSLLNIAQSEDFQNVMVFHSLSKRSNLPGLRSGFCAGDKEQIRAFRLLRELGGVSMPLPTQRASAVLWADDAHVDKNRELYRQKFDLAQHYFGQMDGFARPQGGFFLWFDVRPFHMNSREMTKKLWREAGVRVLAGAFLSKTAIGDDYLRIALVPDYDRLKIAFERMRELFL